MANSDDTPVYKITIQRESPVKGGEPKFTLVPENFTMTSQPSVIPVRQTLLRSPPLSIGSYVKCAVPDCNNYFDGQRCEFMGISYFPFPQDPELRQEWITAIDLPPDKDADQMKVCSDHFMNKDFVSDFIEVEENAKEASESEEGPSSKKAKASETVELKPGVKPSVKLGQVQKMAEYAKETWEKNVQTYCEKSKKSGGKSRFVGLDNPLMDTANELRSSAASSTRMESAPSVPDETITGDMPVITSVGTIQQFTIDDASRDEPIGNKSQKDIDRERANTHGKLVDIVDVDDEDDDEIEEELLTRKLGWQTQKKPDKTQPTREEEKTGEGLVNIPATVKLPPRKTITGECSTTASSNAPELVPSSSKNDATFTNSPDNVMPSTSNAGPPFMSQRTRRKRRTRAEILRKEEEDEWEPTFWSKKTLVKEGYDFEPKRKGQTQKTSIASKNVDFSVDEDELEELDEGFRIDEPVTTRSRSSPEKRRRPGPASRTSRPQYVPEKRTSDQSDADSSRETQSKNGVVEKDLEEVFADKSLLVDWAFFKSIIPDLGRMSREKRDELKNFMLDTLNARIYEGKPIIPTCKDPVIT